MVVSGECLRQKHQLLYFWGNAISGNNRNQIKSKGRGEYQIDEITYAKGGFIQMRKYAYKGEGIEKLVIR